VAATSLLTKCFVCNISVLATRPNADFNYVGLLNTYELEKVDIVQDLGVHVNCSEV